LLKEPKRRRISFVQVIIALVLLTALIPVLSEMSVDKAKIDKNKERFDAAQEELLRIELENEQLARDSEGGISDEYLDRYARDMGYADPQERIYYIN
jgi:hypothetical protein